VESLSVARLFEDQREELQLEQLTESLASQREITVSDVNRPGMALMGFLDNFLPERIQILAQTELTYLATLPPEGVREAIDRLFQFEMPLIIVCKGLEVPPYLVERANECQVPVLRTGQSTTPFIHSLTNYLDHMFAPQTTVHGSLVDVYGCGLLFTGRSGIGKSECALELVSRGHRLVADDIVELRPSGDGRVIGSAPERVRHYMEIRGLGLINIQDLFGVASTRRSKRVELVVQLERWDPTHKYDRVGLDETSYETLGIRVPMIRMPVAPGRNLAILVEVAARNQLLRNGGLNSAQRLVDRLDEELGHAREHADIEFGDDF